MQKMKMKRPRKFDFNTLVFLGPYFLLFFVFIIIPVILAILLSFTHFDSIQFPTFVGIRNYINLATQDATFMRYVLPNTIRLPL